MSPVQPGSHDKKPSTPTPAASAKPTLAVTVTTEQQKRAVTPRKVFICFGEVQEFNTVGDAEKYLNGDLAAAPKALTVIKGVAIEKKQKVSLR